MSSKWREVKLSNITFKITKGTTPSTIRAAYVDSGINFIKSESISDSRVLDRSKYAFIDIVTHEKLKRSQIKINDILFSMAGMFLGKTGIVMKHDVPANTNQAVAIIRVMEDYANYKYIYYYLSQPKIKEFVNGSISQSAQPNINLKQIGELNILLPTLKEQKVIAATLSCIDEKIEFNNQINKNLEEVAKAIYKSWFVDFEPFQNGEFEENELRCIPKGWEIKQLGEIIKKNKEKINNFDDWKNELIIDLSNMPQFSMCINQFDKGEKFATNIYKLSKYDILFGSIRSYFGKAGFSPIDGVVTGTVHSYKPINNEDYSFVLLLTTSKKFIDYTVAVSTGTKMPIVNWDNFCRYNCIYPNSESILSEFNELIMPLIKKMENNILETQKLISIRDSLLPKLMSGEIRVPLEDINE